MKNQSIIVFSEKLKEAKFNLKISDIFEFIH
jgi:hypothetical protein